MSRRGHGHCIITTLASVNNEVPGDVRMLKRKVKKKLFLVLLENVNFLSHPATHKWKFHLLYFVCFETFPSETYYLISAVSRKHEDKRNFLKTFAILVTIRLD